MADDPTIETEESPAPSRRRRRLLRIGIAGTGVAALLLGGLWLARKPIALHFIAQTLREKGVAATYEIIRIGPRTQRLERLVLGDPRRPDLVADWVEVDLGYSFSGVRVTGLRTGKVAINARYHEGRLDLGSLDKLMGEGGGGTTELPDIMAQIGEVRVRLATDAGAVDLALDGTGNLYSGFAGWLFAGSPRLAAGGCALDRLTAKTRLTTRSGQAQLKGPVTAQGLACPDGRFALAQPRIDADLRTDPALSDINGAFALAAASAGQAERTLGGLSGLVTVKGSSEELRGSASLSARKAALGFATVGLIKLGGDYAVRPSPKEQDYSYAATLTAEEIRPVGRDPYGALVQQAAGTPLAPLAQKLNGGLRDASHANRLTLSGRVTGEAQRMELLVTGADFAASSGARLAMREGSRFTLNLPRADWTLDGGLEMRGGGLPEAQLAIANRPDGGVAGTLTLADYRAGTARLGLTPVRFIRSRPGALRLNTTVSLDGPLGEGAVRGLTMPLDVTMTERGDIRLPRDCAPVRWTALRIATAAFDAARLDLCGIGGDTLSTGKIALRGRIGESPLALGADGARYALGSGRFDVAALDARIGAGESPILLHAGTLDGSFGKEGFSGTLAGGNALIGAVPLNLTAIAGGWRFTDGALSVDGALRVSDRQQDARFTPLDATGAHLTLENGRIAARGTLVHPSRKANIATVVIGHDLGTGEGQADFALANLRFGDAIQPAEITPMALGIVANVEGLVEGTGSIRWSGEGVTQSTGTFSTQDMNFAAAFGPVHGFSTTIRFVDLLGLKTAPHQRLTVKQVSPGVDVFDGVIDYALLSNEKAQIEGGHWPFSGGTLELLPATLNLDARQPRAFTFRVVGLDAAAFVNTFQMQNLDVHGTLDGLLPMIFDANGGRIEGGVLVARQQGLPPLVLASPSDTLPPCDNARQGGSLAYVGAVSNAQLGTMGKFAFDALKHFNYRCLVVHLDGALDGEFVTQIRLNGINQGVGTKHNWLVQPFLKLPIIFNIRIEAPFRRLLNDYRRLNDPGELLRQELERQRAAKANSALAVQPADSENVTEGNK